MKRRPSGAGGSKLERRKEGDPFPASIPVEVSWKCAEGAPIEHEGVVRQVNEMGTYP